MKKEYSKPLIKAYQISSTSILAVSGSNVGSSTTPYEDSNNTSVGGMKNGIWGTTNDPD